MRYEIQLSDDVETKLQGLEGAFKETVEKLLLKLAENPYIGQGPTEASPGIYYLRLSDGWRLLYLLEEAKKTVRVEYLGNEPVLLRPEGDSTVIEPWKRPTREEAIKIVEAGIGKRPDLPSGADYVDQIWGRSRVHGQSDS